jgi:hypothetical protein
MFSNANIQSTDYTGLNLVKIETLCIKGYKIPFSMKLDRASPSCLLPGLSMSKPRKLSRWRMSKFHLRLNKGIAPPLYSVLHEVWLSNILYR